jgi:hypothetical protein
MTSLFGYHDLRDHERRRWKHRPPATALTRTDRERLAALVARLLPYSERQQVAFVHVSPNPADRAAARLCAAYQGGTEAERAFIRSRVREEHGWILLTFSKRAATRGFQAKTAGPIRQALIALAVEDLSAGDVRDDLMALGLIHHCATKIRADSPALFEEVARRAGPGMAAVLREFIGRDDLDADMLGGMGFERARSRGKAGFQVEDD